MSFYGVKLPLPRKVSTDVFPCHDGTLSDKTHLFALFGKLLKFDMFRTSRGTTDEECCGNCLGIDTNAATDERVTNGCAKCMPYKKPILEYDLKCTANNQGKNDVTAPLDLSLLYSSTDFSGTLTNGKFDLTTGFLSKTGVKFSGVSDAINENPLVMALYHVFLREHNKLVDKMTEFGNANPLEATKKLLTGIFQHITYNEYLPLLIGEQLPTSTYEAEILPIISNSFSLAYELVLASMLRETVKISPTENKDLTDLMNNAAVVDDETKLKNIIEGMLNEASLKIGRKIPCNFRDNCKYSDIVSVLTQDTRYLAIPPYVIWLAIWNENQIQTFGDLPFHTAVDKTALEKTYNTVYDMDFLSGMFTEIIDNDKPAGKTLLKLMKDQFVSIQNSDRFYYEHTGVFLADQLAEIKKTSMALLLCRNIDNLDKVKEKAFELASGDVDCSTIPEIDFCKYHGVASTWTAFRIAPGTCRFFQIQARKCQSSRVDACPCIGSPFKIESCPNQITTPEMQLIYRFLEMRMGNDAQSLAYKDNYEKLMERAQFLFEEMTNK
ncbi:peroxidase mlt-7 [Octopus bimaculoides]|uniref:Uncharacterized protein n=1 Tax=Octopus bimaculoides TaxID=37653 RepID=A0A0L8GB68_OCTBM|nr:peroxidase mlt-7 [Octopus bimaculoides]|eukprot:XP_014782529.1 PREDICTED: peroxidase mlt-7-like [Octopus bimaculoides]